MAAVQTLLHTLQWLVDQQVRTAGTAANRSNRATDGHPVTPAGTAAAAGLLTHGAAVLQPTPGASPGAWCGLRLLPGEALDGRMEGLRRWLADALLAAPPHAMRWLRGHPMRVGACGTHTRNCMHHWSGSCGLRCRAAFNRWGEVHV